ncbi:RhuM family protein [Bifidobacterium aesculapii]|uniref:RhuM family protein n=1 Tax=Bifidobacterium aesculapii TaxID=1329411 RepID=UPI0009E90C71|nr:RhuM family protein [Bifidobacterium aesculapii]
MQKHIADSNKPVAYYNLDVIISVGYRVKLHRGVQFRRWTTGARRYRCGRKSLESIRRHVGGEEGYREKRHR